MKHVRAPLVLAALAAVVSIPVLVSGLLPAPDEQIRLETIDALERADSAIERDALLASRVISGSFDALSDDERAGALASGTLLDVDPGPLANEVKARLEKKSALAEDVKSEASVLRNSLRMLARLSAENDDPAVDDIAMRCLAYFAGADDAGLREQAELLARKSAPNAQLAARHALLVLDRKSALDGAISGLLEIDVSAPLRAMESSEDARVAASSATRRSRLDEGLIGLGAAALLVLASILRSRQTQRDLEREVASRTAELSHAKETLEEKFAELEAARKTLAESERLAVAGRLAASLGHEINNPLTYLIISVQQVMEMLPLSVDVSRPPWIEVMELLREADSGASRIARIVKSLRTAMRPDNAERTPVALGDVIEGAVRVAANHIRHKATLHVELGPAPMISGNAQKLGQVVLNLLINAAQSIDAGGIGENEVSVTLGASGDGCAEILVSDSGSGLSPEARERLFEPFFTTRVAEGSGLGLFVSRGIIADHGGTIDVLDRSPRGTTFRIRLPGIPGDESALKKRA